MEKIMYFAESSYDFEDKNKEFKENVVVFADFGEEGTKTVSTIDGIENLQAIKDLLNFFQNSTT